jgi:sigma-B regulation protein RsbU (phosphoserine phosphatase)
MSLSKKLALIICIFSLALSAAIGVVGYRTYLNSTLTRYEEFAVSVLNLARSYIDGDDMLSCFESGEKSPQYYQTQQSLNNIKEQTGITFLYFFTLTEQRDKMIYYMSAFTQDEVGVYHISTLYDEDELPDELSLLADIDDIHIIPNRSEYGYMMSAYGTVRNSHGDVIGIIGADIDMLDVNSTLRSYVITVLVGAVLFMALLTVLVFAYLRKKITVPIQTLSLLSDNFVKNTRDSDFEPIVSGIKTGGEIETLANSIEKMTADLITYIDNLTAVTAEKERISAELNVATQIQASMLPCIFPAFPECTQFDIFACMQPAKEVGGDFYDFFLIDKNTLAVIIADVSGKGVPAALFMVIAKTLIKNNAQYGKSPQQVFETVNNMLCENNDTGMFVTAFMGYLQIDSGKFVFVNAGHNPPLIKKVEKGGDFELLKTPKCFVLAGMEDMPYKQSEIILSPNDELFLYTDGVTEADNHDKELFGEPRLLNIVNNMGSESLNEFTDKIKQKIDEFADGAEQADDITMLTLRYKGG